MVGVFVALLRALWSIFMIHVPLLRALCGQYICSSLEGLMVSMRWYLGCTSNPSPLTEAFMAVPGSGDHRRPDA